VRVALRFKVGRKHQPLTDTERDMVAAAIVEQNEASGEEPIIEPCRDGAFQTHGRPRHVPILGPYPSRTIAEALLRRHLERRRDCA
jgi:hypothetical protein